MIKSTKVTRATLAVLMGGALAVSPVLPCTMTVALADEAATDQLASVASGDCTKPDTEGSVSWRVAGNVLTISGDGYMACYGEAVKAPWREYVDEVDTIVIEDGVKSIGNYAFAGFYQVKSVVIPDSVKTIGYCSFYYCESLSSVDMGSGIDSIGFDAFYKCSLPSEFYKDEVGPHSLSTMEAGTPDDGGGSYIPSRVHIHPTVTVEDWTYGEEPSVPVVEGNKGKGKETLEYCVRPVDDELRLREDDELATAAAAKADEEEVEWLAWPPVEAGTYTLRVSIAKTSRYYAAEATCDFEVHKATPEIGEVSATVKHGTLDPADVVFTRTDETLPGSISLVEEELVLGESTYNWVFTPEDSTNYEQVTGTVDLNVEELWQGWKLIDGKWYHYVDDEPLTGWYWSDTYKNWFWMGEDGAMCTGWQYVDGDWYLFDENGIMLVGWQWSEEYQGWYYFNQAHDGKYGCMLRNTTAPDGAKIGPDGRWMK